MMRHGKKNVHRRRSRGVVRHTFRIIGALGLFAYDKVRKDVAIVVRNGRLFTGTLLVIVGFFSFASGRYCDGNLSDHYTCTRPSTYYYYPWWAILFITLGSFCIVLWFLRRKKK